MTDSLPWIGLLVAFAVLSYFGIPRLVAHWFANKAWTLSSEDLEQKFRGLILFGLDGSYIALLPEDRPDTISFTKSSAGEGEMTIKLGIASSRLTCDCVAAIELQLDAQRNRIQWSVVDSTIPGLLEIDIRGPVALDAAGMERVTSDVLATLGYTSSQKYRIAFEGPTDEERVAEFFRSR